MIVSTRSSISLNLAIAARRTRALRSGRRELCSQFGRDQRQQTAIVDTHDLSNPGIIEEVQMKKIGILLLMTLAGLGTISSARSATDDEIIKSAMSAAPEAVSKDATIIAVETDGKMRTVREGTNGWWCMADSPATPGPDPMCGDPNSMEWAMAWMEKREPPKGKVGFMYMLAGGTDASNTDPYATAPTEGNNWVKTGPHVMIVNAGELMSGYPTEPKPNTAAPYVMWHGTPYAHLMIPVQ
jgi:hypothetical protein